MSEVINNREYRRKVLKDLITELHNGKSVEDVKKRFEETFEGVSASEIAEVEQALIMDGMPVTEIQRLCDVHAAVFKGSIEETNKPEAKDEHQIEIMKSENRALEKLIREQLVPRIRELEKGDPGAVNQLEKDIEMLWQVDIHYKKLENILFPYLEKYGVTAPPKVMWGVEDEIRNLIKESKAALKAGDNETVKTKLGEAMSKVLEMIFKEENILFPVMLESFSEDEWKRIASDTAEYGYCLIGEDKENKAQAENVNVEEHTADGLKFPTGSMTLEELTCVLNTLPFDVTFVGKDDTVKYFSQGKERIFARTKAVIGRKVANCHPPASVHIVEKIVADFKSGAKDHEDFWIRMGDKYVYIRYFAVRNETGEYLGVLEVTQNIAPVQAIQGEKRLLSE